MNARFRKGRVYEILQGRFRGVRLLYLGFNPATKEYIFRDGTVNPDIAIKWAIRDNHKYAFNQMENEWQK